MSLVQISQVDFCYNAGQPLLEDLNLQLEAGHIHGLLGRNGEGKSTLLKLIAGLVHPQRGTITTLGLAPHRRLPEMLRNIYFFSEEMPSFNLSIQGFMRAYAPFYPNFSAEHFEYNLREFSIPSAKANMGRLSFGQRKKVIISFGLATNAQLLLMDEPTNGLDIPSKRQFRRLVAEAVGSERCIVISTHQVRDLDSLIDNVIIMDAHQIALCQTTGEIARKLMFTENADKLPDALYTEYSPRGTFNVTPNTSGADSKLDLELLFNAIITNRHGVQQQLR